MVGYVNLTLKPGFQLISNPLDNKNANGNTISNLFAACPDGTTVYKYDGAAFSINGLDFGVWANPNQTLVPGEGAFVLLPAGADVTVLFVGDVPTGNLSTTIKKGLSIVSSQVPQAGLLETDLKYAPVDGDSVYQWKHASQSYSILGYDFGSWTAQPNLAVGEAIFLSSADDKTWTRTFNVGP
jgi:hypothetical protein